MEKPQARPFEIERTNARVTIEWSEGDTDYEMTGETNEVIVDINNNFIQDDLIFNGAYDNIISQGTPADYTIKFHIDDQGKAFTVTERPHEEKPKHEVKYNASIRISQSTAAAIEAARVLVGAPVDATFVLDGWSPQPILRDGHEETDVTFYWTDSF